MLGQESRKHGRSRGIDFLLGCEPPLSDLGPEQHQTEEQPETQDDSFHFSNFLESGFYCGPGTAVWGELTLSENKSGNLHMDQL